MAKPETPEQELKRLRGAVENLTNVNTQLRKELDESRAANARARDAGKVEAYEYALKCSQPADTYGGLQVRRGPWG